MPRTEENIKTLHPNAQLWARLFLKSIRESGILPKGMTVEIISGNRTWREQDALFAKGRTAPGSIVTYARGGQSNHNFGIAWDIGLFQDGTYLGNSPVYSKLGPIGEEIGLEWGGRWKKLQDTPHYQIRNGLSLGEMRSLVRSGKPIPCPKPEGRIGETPKRAVKTVTILDGGKPTEIQAFEEQGRIWVAIRKFLDVFGGEIDEIDGSTFIITLHDEQISVQGMIRAGLGFVKFIDVNRVLDVEYSYDGKQLSIISSEERDADQ
jgi:peptidoglycan L-alanyl-D-glutamate endopeptidase CwlK